MGQYKMKINTENRGIEISPTFIGLFFEDINYGADGGLYAELVNNRSFEFGSFKNTFSKHEDYFYAWSVVTKGGGELIHTQASAEPIHENNPNYLQVQINQVGEEVGISNEGFSGISIEAGKKYDFSVYLSNESYEGDISIRLEGNDGKVYAQEKIDNSQIQNSWTKHELTLTSNTTDAQAKLTLLFNQTGVINIDMVSLFPQDTWKGRKNGLRKDLVEMLEALEPKFLRFPGGCIVEGKTLNNAYNWKDTIGPVEHRKMNWSRWEEWDKVPYNQTYGLGFYEYFQLAEDIGATPLPILNCGMSCQFQSGEIAEDIEPFIQDALDLIEYANGDETTFWGKKRIESGHLEPFNLIYLGIGNEQWVDLDKPFKDRYFEIYEMFCARIKEKYPEIKLVTTSGPSPQGTEFDSAWKVIKEKTEDYIKQNKVYTELVDEHYYMSPEWFIKNVNRYDDYVRYSDGISAKVFAGEYACHTQDIEGKGARNNLYAALCEAAFITGMERNSDVVQMTSYAPLFVKVNNIQWKPDLIWFDNQKVFGTPSYYVQKMYGNNMGTYILKTSEELPIHKVVSWDEKTGDIIVKMVNVEDRAYTIDIEIETPQEINSIAQCTLLTSKNKEDENTLENPDYVSEKVFTIEGITQNFSYTIEANSFVVLRLHTH